MELRIVGLGLILLVSGFVPAFAPGVSASHQPDAWREIPEDRDVFLHTGESMTFEAGVRASDGCNLDYVWWGDLTGEQDIEPEKETDVSGSEDTSDWTYTFTEPGDFTIDVAPHDDCDNIRKDDLWDVHVRENFEPTPCASVSPDQGPVSERFIADASCSTDDDDSDGDLEYRVDWQNDGTWDTSWLDVDTTTDNSYPDGGERTVAVEVRDPKGATNCCSFETVKVDGKPTADFSVDEEHKAPGETFHFDGSGSSDHPTGASSLEYRWQWTKDGDWTAWSSEATAENEYEQAGEYDVTLEVRDEEDQRDRTTRTLLVSESPSADISVDPPTGFGVSTGGKITSFTFDASGSTDDETPSDQIQVRWDWDSDGAYDTEWSTDKTEERTFDAGGEKVVTLQVKAEGQTASTIEEVWVVGDSEIQIWPTAWGLRGTPGSTVFTAWHGPQGRDAADIRIAVVDTGLDRFHEDLERDRILQGWDYVNGEATPEDCLGHGTNITGLLAASMGQNGIAGIADVEIVPLRIHGCEMDLSAGDQDMWRRMAQAIRDGADPTGWDADIVLIASGCDPYPDIWNPVDSYQKSEACNPSTEPEREVVEAIQAAWQDGALLISSAGNYGPCDSDCVAFPANQPNVLTISAVDRNGDLASTQSKASSSGPSVDLAAPGLNHWTIGASPNQNDDYYIWPGGTSAAVAFASGAAALTWAAHPGWDNVQIRDRLESTANPLPGLSELEQGSGAVDACEAVGSDQCET